MLTVGIDVGGTKIAAGLVDEDGRVLARDRVETPVRDVGAVVEACAGLVGRVSNGHEGQVVAVGIGVPGFVAADRATVLRVPNLGWLVEPLRDRVTATIGLPVVVENDANAAAWGEARHGAGRGVDDLVVVTVGTGIGGGLILGGQLYRGGYGVAAEVGHLTVVPDGRPCGCGRRGCWEQYASGNALVRTARELASEHRSEAGVLLAYGDGSPEGVSGLDVTRAAADGDPVAVRAFAEVGRWLGWGLADLAAVLDPTAFVIGGGVSEAGDLLLGPTRAAYLERLVAREQRPVAEVRLASLRNDAGLVGVADLARH